MHSYPYFLLLYGKQYEILNINSLSLNCGTIDYNWLEMGFNTKFFSAKNIILNNNYRIFLTYFESFFERKQIHFNQL